MFPQSWPVCTGNGVRPWVNLFYFWATAISQRWENVRASGHNPPHPRRVVAKGHQQFQGCIEEHRLILHHIESILRP